MTMTEAEPDVRPPLRTRLLSPGDLEDYLSIGRTAAYALVSPGGPLYDDVIRIGRSVRIPIEAVDAWIDEQRSAR